MLKVDLTTARRFILGKQGLWPGRRWRGLEGTEQAMAAMEYLQLDPLQVVARSHDIQLQSRVLGYTPGMWEVSTYQERKFFDWGGWLATRPMVELPYWRVAMRREREGGPDVDNHIRAMGLDHADAVAEMREVLRERGTVSNRDFEMATRTRTHSYRGRKDSALALHYLWRTGEVMTHHRENFERVYALAEAVAPPDLLRESGEEAVDSSSRRRSAFPASRVCSARPMRSTAAYPSARRSGYVTRCWPMATSSRCRSRGGSSRTMHSRPMWRP